MLSCACTYENDSARYVQSFPNPNLVETPDHYLREFHSVMLKPCGSQRTADSSVPHAYDGADVFFCVVAVRPSAINITCFA